MYKQNGKKILQKDALSYLMPVSIIPLPGKRFSTTNMSRIR